jgi:NADH-quinone oxidoreductase subunit D/NADH-quinone oxidoreductase subunit C/D
VKQEGGFSTDRIVINMGPHHPSTHGVFRAVMTLDGETIVGLKPVMGYLHRNHDKIGERNTYLQNMPFTDRLDYFNSMTNNFGYALAVEKLMNPVAGARNTSVDRVRIEPHPESLHLHRHHAERPRSMYTTALHVRSAN